MVLKRIKIIVAHNVPGQQVDKRILEQVIEYFNTPDSPKNINPNDPESQVNVIQARYDKLNHQLQKETSRDIRKYTLREYFSLVKLIDDRKH